MDNGRRAQALLCGLTLPVAPRNSGHETTDMLDVKWNISRRDYIKTREITEVAMACSPDDTFWYYARAMARTENSTIDVRG